MTSQMLIKNTEASEIAMPHTLNLYSAVRQLNPNKAEGY